MKCGDAQRMRLLPSDYLLLALVSLLPLMKPALRYPVILADPIFLLILGALAVELASGWRRIRWEPPFAILAVYVLSLAPSLLASGNPAQSAFKLAIELYLTGLAVVTIIAVARNESMLRYVTLTWLATTAALVVLCLASVITFVVSPQAALYRYSAFHFGTLPPGHYPRVAGSFFNANMTCNYLTVSLGLLLLAWQQEWLASRPASLLLAGIILAGTATISAGLGGIALLLGLASWLLWRAWSALMIGIATALVFIVALAVTPIIHPTAPFLIEIPGTSIVLAPAGRFLTWTAAASEFVRHPLLGHGIGIDPVHVRYLDPSGDLQELTDAHNVFFSIAAQAGIVGLTGLIALIAYAARMTFSDHAGASIQLVLGVTFLNAFVYQGIGGSFEDTRHLWMLFGLLAAAAQLSLTRADESNRKSAGPSPC